MSNSPLNLVIISKQLQLIDILKNLLFFYQLIQTESFKKYFEIIASLRRHPNSIKGYAYFLFYQSHNLFREAARSKISRKMQSCYLC
jgi:hypothetical protein